MASSEGLRLRLRLSPHDARLLSDLAADEEEPVDTIRRLIRTAALVQPILAALQTGVPLAQPSQPPPVTDLLEQQIGAVSRWVEDD